MTTGTVEDAAKTHNLAAVGLVAVIVICTVVLGVVKPGTAWVVGLTVVSSVAGALLGSVVRLDVSQNVYRVQARPATRHLFDQVRRLRALVVRVENFGQLCRSGEATPERAADWFEAVGNELRGEIEATATAVDNWSDLASDVRDDEWMKYLGREARLPGGREVGDE